MPKIMFRPAPTPPPFVPPTPTYDDTIYIKISPFNFNENEDVVINIQQGNFPPFQYFEIYGSDELLGLNDIVISGQFTPQQFGQDIQENTLYAKSVYQYYTALFTLVDETSYLCNIEFQQF